MDSGHKRVGRHHKPIGRKLCQKRRVILEAERSGIGRERCEIIRDECDFAEPAHPLARLLRRLPSELTLAFLARDTVEHAIHDGGFLAAEKVMRDLDIFVDDRPAPGRRAAR